MKILITENQLRGIVMMEQGVSEKNDFQKFRANNFNLCNVKFEPEFRKSIEWWNQWVSSPVTLKKIMNNHGIDEREAISLVQSYSNYLKNIDYVLFDIYGPNKEVGKTLDWDNLSYQLYGFVNKDINGKIFVNCNKSVHEKMDGEKLYNLAIHEIQHLLDKFIKPINPYEKVNKVFGNESTGITEEKLKSLSLTFGVDINKMRDVVNKWLGDLEKSEQVYHKDYFCDETEKLSNIFSMRKLFNITSPSQDIQPRQLYPYVMREKKDSDVTFFLTCWTKKGFPDFNKMVQGINSMAKNKKSGDGISMV